MKTIVLKLAGALASVLLFAACQKNAHLENVMAASEEAQMSVISSRTEEILPSSGTCNPNAYIVHLESRTQVGSNWEWIWSVQNSNPGNGNNGTIQDLSNWGMQFGTCFVWSNVVSAAYSSDGTTWTSFSPSYSVDPSQNCLTTPVLKFDFGTVGSSKSYYKLVLNAMYPVGPAPAYYKSGTKTGCCTFTFAGVSCGDENEPR